MIPGVPGVPGTKERELGEKRGMTHEMGSRVTDDCFVVTVDFLWG